VLKLGKVRTWWESIRAANSQGSGYELLYGGRRVQSTSCDPCAQNFGPQPQTTPIYCSSIGSVVENFEFWTNFM